MAADIDFDGIRAANELFLTKLKNEAKESGKELFDAEKLLKLYWPIDASNESDALSRIKNLEMDYYLSKAMSLAEFAHERDEYDMTKEYI